MLPVASVALPLEAEMPVAVAVPVAVLGVVVPVAVVVVVVVPALVVRQAVLQVVRHSCDPEAGAGSEPPLRSSVGAAVVAGHFAPF